MSAMQLQQKCPNCDEVLTFDAKVRDDGVIDGKAQFAVSATTTPESTAHVWTHAPEGANQ